MEFFDNALSYVKQMVSIIMEDFYDDHNMYLMHEVTRMLNAILPYARYKDCMDDIRSIIDVLVSALYTELDVVKSSTNHKLAAEHTAALASLIETRVAYDRMERMHLPKGMPTRPNKDCQDVEEIADKLAEGLKNVIHKSGLDFESTDE